MLMSTYSESRGQSESRMNTDLRRPGQPVVKLFPVPPRVSLAAMLAAARRLIRSVKILARDSRIPKPLRGLAAFGVLPIPGPIDEVALLIVGLILWVLYRDTLRGALYKTLHDARRKLRKHLDECGLSLESWLEEAK